MKKLLTIILLSICMIGNAFAESWSGTGFALKDKYIITNHHVVDGARTLLVRGIKGDFTETYNAVVVAKDAMHDMAIIRIEDNNFPGFGDIPYTLKSNISEVGEDIFVLGYPLLSSMGDEIKLTTGVISSRSGIQGDVSAYQISAPIQPGNSGGPLFDTNGDVVGIVNSKHRLADNAGYAIKSPYMRTFIENSISATIIPTNRKMVGWSRISMVKAIKPFVFIIYASTEGGGRLKVSDAGTLKNADVFIDGTFIGCTPITSGCLTSGEHTVRITKPLYKPFTQKVTIRNGVITNCNPTLIADFATVSLTIDNGYDCDIYINNKQVGKGTWHGNLATGIYKFEARKKNHSTTSITKTIVATPNEQRYAIPTPQPVMGKLNVASSPTGADVLIDGKVTGKTPLTLDVIIGLHQIEVSKECYQSEKKSIIIEEGQIGIIDVALNGISPVSLTTADNNYGSMLYINNKLVGYRSWSGNLVAGTYKFEARKDGHTTTSITKTIDASISEQHFILPAPQPIFGKLNIKSFPIGGDVFIDGKIEGQTPLIKDLIIGHHNISVSRNKLQSEDTHVYISEGQTKEINVKLKKYHKLNNHAKSMIDKKRTKTSSWDSFNLGVFADMALITYDSSLFGLGVGLNWRLWRHNSMFIPMIGARYMYGFDNSHAFGFPMVVNGNWLGWFGETKMSCYFGVGIEPIFIKGYTDYYEGWGTEVRYGVSSWDCAIIINIIGCSWRHHDFNSYVNIGLKNDDNYSVGFRYTYFF